MSGSDKDYRELEKVLTDAELTHKKMGRNLKVLRTGLKRARSSPPAPPAARKGRRKTGRGRTADEKPEPVHAIVVDRPAENILMTVENHTPPVNLGRCHILVVLLRGLCETDAGAGTCGDGVVPPKTKEELMDFIREFTGKVINKEALRNHILRLRDRLKDAGLPREYVETVDGDYRFRMRADGQLIIRLDDGFWTRPNA